jgi:protein SCO1/2
MRTTNRGGRRTAAAGWLTVLALAAGTAADARADNARWGADYFPNITLTTQDGARVRFYDDLVKGKIVAINLIYTTCKYACPLETARLSQVAKLLGDRMGRDVFFYSITIDPEHDTPQVLKEYAAKYQAGPGWTFLTGKKGEIDALSKKLGLYSEPDPSNPDGHTPMLVIGNEETGQWMRNSALDNPKFLSRTIGDWLNSWQTAKKATTSYSDVPAFTFDQGAYTFKNHCAACHTIGGGEHFGPDLQNVASTRDRGWLSRFIVDPEKVRAAGDPIALALRAKYQQVVMPSLDLGADDAAVLIDYIDKQSREPAAPKPRRDEGGPREVAGTSGAAATAAPAGAVNLTPIVAPYLRIQQALHADTLGDASHDGRSIAAAAAALGSRGAAIAAAAAELQQAGDLAAARTAFGRLGDAIMACAKESGAALGDEVKVAYCPMKQKYWLQKGETIQNPFYGSAMPDCGRLKDGLPGGKE